MGWFKTRDGRLVHGVGGLARVYLARGYEPADDPIEVEQPVPVTLTVEHQPYAELTDGEQAAVDRVIADETPVIAPHTPTRWDD